MKMRWYMHGLDLRSDPMQYEKKLISHGFRTPCKMNNIMGSHGQIYDLESM